MLASFLDNMTGFLSWILLVSFTQLNQDSVSVNSLIFNSVPSDDLAFFTDCHLVDSRDPVDMTELTKFEGFPIQSIVSNSRSQFIRPK